MIALLAAFALATAAPAGDLQSTLRAKDQALLNAIAPGDRSVWEAALAPDAVYVDENGTIMDRAKFLAQLEPLPAGLSGHIDITDYKLVENGDIAMVVHADDEYETFHGHDLRARYLMTETWLRRAGQWKLSLVHAYVVAEDPPAVAATPAELDSYVGRYRAAPDLVYVIRRDGDHLLGGVEGGTQRPLMVETANVLFMPGQPRIRKIFQRDAHGHVIEFINRREGEDLHWVAIKAPGADHPAAKQP